MGDIRLPPAASGASGEQTTALPTPAHVFMR
jgi:hypothetical protein